MKIPAMARSLEEGFGENFLQEGLPDSSNFLWELWVHWDGGAGLPFLSRLTDRLGISDARASAVSKVQFRTWPPAFLSAVIKWKWYPGTLTPSM